jgi:hypothetical protein
MSKVIFNIGVLRGSRELQPYDMIPSHSVHAHYSRTFDVKHSNEHKVFTPPLMNPAITPNMAFKTKGCKDDFNAVKVIRRPAMNPMAGLYPQVGWARHQKKGLAYDPAKPINTKLMPLSSNFYAGLNNSIPQPV